MENSRHAAPRRGMAIFAVLSLMVVFTVLGVAAISIAQRDNSASGSVFDIKQREAAAYSGLVYAQNELARDPVNLLNILESWRLKTIYGTATAPYPALYLKFDATNKVALTTTKPAPFLIPGTNSSITVEVTGISLPATSSEEPNIALRSTGSGSSGDEQTLLGVYQIKNIRVSSNSATMPITHPLYVSGGGNWNNTLRIIDGSAYFGNDMQLNGTVKSLFIEKAGLRVFGNFRTNGLTDFVVDSNVYINGNFDINGLIGNVDLKQNMVVTGNFNFSTTGVRTAIRRSLYVLGNPGFVDLQQEFLDIGTGPGVTDAIFYVPNGELVMGNNSWIRVNGSAFLRQIKGTTPFALDVTKRLELADKGLDQQFTGTGKWGQLVVRSAATTSSFRNATVNIPASPAMGANRASDGIQLGVPNSFATSWIGGFEFELGLVGDEIGSNSLHPIETRDGSEFRIQGHSSFPLSSSPPSSANISLVPGTEGFETDLALAPKTELALTGALRPSDVNDREPTLDWVSDPTALSKAWVATGSSSCSDPGKICGKAIQEAYNADVTSRKYFHNEFFVVKLTGTGWTWDAGGIETSKLKGKYLFYVEEDMSGSMPWPTTEINTPLTNPKNVIFVYGRGKGKMFGGFSPRYKKNASLPVEFTGYVRYDATICNDISWTPETELIFRGAVHVVGPNPNTPGSSRCQNFTINSAPNPNSTTTFQFDQGALNAIGASFGTNFILPDGSNLGPPPDQFLLMENWVQFRTLGELR